jgi:hypothetical protein
MSAPDTEILVHITAHSTAADDKHYRSQAAAFHAFESTTSRPIFAAIVPRSGDVAHTRPPPGTAPNASGQSQSPQLSFEGVLHNLGSPDLPPAYPQYSQPQSQASVLSWRTPPSVVADSDPDGRAAVTQYTSPTRLFEHLVRSPNTPSPRSRTTGTQSQQLSVPLAPSEVIPDRPAHQDAAVQASSRSETRDRTPDGDLWRISAGDVDLGLGPFTSSEPEGTRRSVDRAGSEPLVALGHLSRRDVAASPALARSSSDTIFLNEQLSASAQEKATEAARALKLTEVHAPSPAVSCDDLAPEQLLTPNLRALINKMASRFKPHSVIRKLDPWERGYWLVECAEWTPVEWKARWYGLTNYIRDSKAGWGISCSRDRDFKWLRLYCWGYVVKHTYLALYVVTQRQLPKARARWVDSQGKTCIVMEVQER